MRRHLAAILVLDVVNYTRHVAEAPDATLAWLQRSFREVVRPTVRREAGRIVKLTGDGAVVAFESARAALNAAVAIQRALRSDAVSNPRAISVRAGLHLGDIFDDGGDVFGEAVNIASRLEAAAPAGGIWLSRALREAAGVERSVAIEDLGLRDFKNVSEPIHVFAVDLDREAPERRYAELAASQVVRFCHASDGTRIAYSCVGKGPPLVKAANWLNHQELDWTNPLYRHNYAFLASERTLWRYDARGNGLSDWDPHELSFEAFVQDLAAVFDATGLKRAPLFAASQGCAVAVAYAARRPERVSALVFLGGFAQGRERRTSIRDRDQAQALQAMMRTSWEDQNLSFHEYLAGLRAPNATPNEKRLICEHMRQATSAENMARIRAAVDAIDVTTLLPEIRAPTLVLHGRGDRQQPLEQGRLLAAGIPSAQLVVLETDSHVMLEHDPALPHARAEMRRFLAEHDRD